MQRNNIQATKIIIDGQESFINFKCVDCQNKKNILQGFKMVRIMEHKLDQYFKCSCGFLTMSYLNALEHIGVNTENKTTSLTDGKNNA